MDLPPPRKMELASIQWWEPPTGEHLVLLPTEATQQAALVAPITDKRPALAQESHIKIAAEKRESGGVWSPWLAEAVKIPLSLDREAFVKACTWAIKRHQTLQSWFDVKDLNADLTRRILDPEDIEFELVSRGMLENSDDAREAIWQRLRDETSPLAWPSFILGAIDTSGVDGDTDSFIFYYGVDHTHSDGASLIFFGEEWYDLYEAAHEGRDNPLAPDHAHSYIDFAHEERALGDSLSLDSPALVPWLQALENNGGEMPTYPFDLGLAPGESTESVRTKVDLATPEEMAAIDAVCFPLGVGTTAGIFSALAMVDAELAGRTSFMALNAMMTRTDPKYWFAQGWFVNLVPLSILMPESGRYTDYLVAMQESVQLSKQAIAMPVRSIFDAVAEVVEGGSVAATQVPPMVSYVDYSKFRIAHHPVIEECWGIVGPGSTNGVSMWINRGPDRMYIVVSHPNTPQAIASVEKFAETFKRILKTVAAEGDYVVGQGA